MFEHLRPFRVVLVAGPQRSGTSVATKMIAADAGKTAVLEEAFRVQDTERWRQMAGQGNNVVIQCPTMTRYLCEFGYRDDVVIAFMVRPLRDIFDSQDRANWPLHEKLRELSRYGLTSGEPARVKYDYWATTQRPRVRHWYEVDYSALYFHELWLGDDMRIKFNKRQTAV